MILISCALFSSKLLAFSCFYTLVKDSCWTDYTVTVVVTNVDTNKKLVTVTVPKGQSWARQAFSCEPNEKLNYTATFEPTIWENGKGALYKAQHYWALPDEPTAKQKAWDIPVCYPSAFAEVPFPPAAGGNCKCDFKSVPPIPPVKG